MILGVQILGILFAIGISFFTYMNFKRKELNKIELSVWLTIWVLFLGVVLVPNVLDVVTKSLSFSRTFDFLTVVAILFLTALTFHNYIIVKNNEKRTNELVRKVAMENKK